MIEVIFLVCLGILGIGFAVVQDLKTREVANWLSVSLGVFALGFRFFFGLFSSDVDFGLFYQGLIGLGIFFVLGNLFYYSRIFAGGDAKLMMALGAILPFFDNFSDNLKVFLIFLFLFLFAGAIYGLVSSAGIALLNRKKFAAEFGKQFSKKKKLVYLSLIFGIVFLALGFLDSLFLLVGIFLFFIPYLYLFAKSVDEACMIRKLSPRMLREGDWLYENVRVGKKLLKANWDGLSKKEIGLIKKSGKKVLVRTGIPYTPVFLISFAILSFVILFRESFLALLYFLN